MISTVTNSDYDKLSGFHSKFYNYVKTVIIAISNIESSK